MKKLFSAITMMALVAGLTLPACGQSVEGLEAERKVRIVENLKFLFDQLRPHTVDVNLSPSPLPGLTKGEIVVNGDAVQEFLLSADDQMFLIAGGPFDVGLSTQDLADLQRDRAAAEAEEARQRAAALETLTEGLPARGNPDAPITIIEFSDFQCPYCSRVVGTVDTVLEKYGEDVKLVYLHFPLPNHPWAMPAAIASVCAADQDDDAFWALHDHYFTNQRAMTPENVITQSQSALAGSGIDLAAWEACASNTSSPAHQVAAAKVEGDLAIGRQFGISGTPGFFVNGYFLNGAKPLNEFEDALARAKANL